LRIAQAPRHDSILTIFALNEVMTSGFFLRFQETRMHLRKSSRPGLPWNAPTSGFS
jgi:hypothetical protein